MSRPLVWTWSGGLKSWDWALGSGLYDPELGKRRSSNALSSGRSMKRKAKRTHKTMMIIKRSSFYMNGIDNVTSTNSHTCAQTFMFIYGFLSLASSVLCIAFSIWCFEECGGVPWWRRRNVKLYLGIVDPNWECFKCVSVWGTPADMRVFWFIGHVVGLIVNY